MGKIKIMLVDDHQVVRLGLMTLINDQPNMEVVGEAGTSSEALEAVGRLKPDVILMDIRMPGPGGIDATRQISSRFPESKVIMLTSHPDDNLVIRAISAGAVGYVLKDVGNAELLRAISAVARGEALLDPGTTARLIRLVKEYESKTHQEAFRDLSERELEVTAEIKYGKTNAEIARRLNLSEKTVRNYVSSILEKLNLTNRIELAAYAAKHHIEDYLDKLP